MTEVITDFHCIKCKKYYSSQSSLCNHNKKFHSKINNTNNNTYNTTDNTTDNTNNIITTKRYYCNKCNRDFINYQNRWKHEKICKQNSDLINSDNKLEKIINENIEIKKENNEIKNMLKELLKKNCKIHAKTFHKNNNDTINITSDIVLNQFNNNVLESNDNINITSDNSINFSDNELKSYEKIIKSDDNKFHFDLNKNFLTFNNKPIKYFYYNDQVYFKAKDIAKMLDYKNKSQAIRFNVNKKDRIKIKQLLGDGLQDSPSPETSLLESEHPNTVFINESGFYCLILASKKEEAIEFKDWVTSKVLPSIRKTGGYNLIDNYIEEDLEKYQNKDCVYIIHIKDNIYKYGNTSHIFKRLQAHKTNLKYNKIIKIYDMNNMNEAIKLENKIKTLIKTLKINTVYNTHVEIFEVDNNNLQNLIKKIDELSLKIINNKNININNEEIINENIKNLDIEKEKTKQLELKNKNLELKLELLRLSK